MRVRIKNKHLILALLIFIASTSLVYASGGYLLYFRAEAAKALKNYVKALAYYDALITRYPDHEYVPKALTETILMLADSRDYLTATFLHNRSSRTIPPPEYEELLQSDALTLEERCWMLYEFYQDPDFMDYKYYELKLVFDELATILEERDLAEAEEFYWSIIKNREFRVLLEATERLIMLYLQCDMIDEAVAVWEEAASYSSQLSIFTEWLGHIYFAQGDYEQAKEIYKQGWSSWAAMQKIEMLKKVEGNGKHLIKGAVTINGAPFPGVKVLVYPGPEIIEGDGWYRVRRSSDEYFSVKTRSDGQFVLRLPDGEFEIGIELNRFQMEQVDGLQLRIKNSELSLGPQVLESEKVEFSFIEPLRVIQPEPGFEYSGGPIEIEWTPYPEADYYLVEVYCTFSNPDGKPIVERAWAAKTETTSICLDSLWDPPFFLVFDGEGIHPEALLGRPERIGILIDARTFDGRILPANDALNLFGRPREPGWFTAIFPELTQEEKLIMDRRYAEAFELLQQKITEDPDNLDVLWLLARFYYFGTYVTDHTSLSNFSNRDLDKCLATLRRIEKLAPGPRVEKWMEIVLRELEERQR
ncbi:MAG: tetratricopeptide repeat protein [Candidatus Wallacebacter cryptica]|nr:tetratricopeptide repeat protein [Bacillota bacterium]